MVNRLVPEMTRITIRYPSVPAEAGHYESIFMKASPPEGGRSLWVRHTVHKKPGEEPTGAIWMTYFTANGKPPVAIKRQVGVDGLSAPRGAYLRVGESEVGPGRMSGEVEAEERAASWNLRFRDLHPPHRHLPQKWMYERSVPSTKASSPHPAAVFDGILEVGGERIGVDAWPGVIGHNWGSEHADSWIWINGHDRQGSPGDHIDLTIGRLRIGPVRTPWIANGQLVIDGEAHRLGGIARAPATRVEARPTGARFRIPGDGASLEGKIEAPADHFVGWIYSNPGDGEHHAINSSVANLELRITRRADEQRRVHIPRSAVYEFGTRETDHGVEIQPFPDG